MNPARSIPLVTLLLVGVACAAQAPNEATDAGDKAVPTFGSLDTNTDGSLSPAEAERFPQAAAVFVEADANYDGRLNRDEYRDAVETLIAG